jgi:ribosomal protein S21
LQGVSRKGSESFESLVRRFNRRVQQSGKLTSFRKKRYLEKEPSKTEQRMTAIRKEQRKKAKNKSMLMKGF